MEAPSGGPGAAVFRRRRGAWGRCDGGTLEPNGLRHRTGGPFSRLAPQTPLNSMPRPPRRPACAYRPAPVTPERPRTQPGCRGAGQAEMSELTPPVEWLK